MRIFSVNRVRSSNSYSVSQITDHFRDYRKNSAVKIEEKFIEEVRKLERGPDNQGAFTNAQKQALLDQPAFLANFRRELVNLFGGPLSTWLWAFVMLAVRSLFFDGKPINGYQ